MHAIEGSLPDVDFVEPDPTAISGQIVDVPDVTGQEASEAADELRNAGFVPNVGRYVDSRLPKGQVAYTSPVAGARVGTGTLVTMFISDGTPKKSGGGGSGGGGGSTDGGGGGTTDGGGAGGDATTAPGNNGNGNGNGNGRGRGGRR